MAQKNVTTPLVYDLQTTTTIGRNGGGGGGNPFVGRIDDARVYDRALSAGELRAVASGQDRSGDSTNITIEAVNDEPTLNNLDGNPTFIEDGSPVVLDADVTFGDVDIDRGEDDFDGIDVSLRRNDSPNAEDVFVASGNLSPLTSGGSLTLSGVTIGNVVQNDSGVLSFRFNDVANQSRVDETLQSIAYQNTSDAPPTSVTIDWIVEDDNAGPQGGGGNAEITRTSTVNLVDRPDGADLTVPIASQNVNEDTPLTFSNANGNAIAIDSGHSSDPPLTVTLSVDDGGLTLATTAGIDFLDGTADGGALLTIVGTELAINAALDGLQYVGAADFNGSDTLSLTTGSATTAEANLYARFEFLGGSFEDQTSNDRDGVAIGDPVAVNDAQRGGVMEFDGDDRIVVANSVASLGDEVTIAAWVNLDAGQNDNVFLSIGDEIYVTLDQSTAVEMGLTVSNFKTGYNSSAGNIAGTGWNHIAATVDNAAKQVRLYLNGELVRGSSFSFDDTDWSAANSSHITIGSLADGSNAFSGRIDDVRIYDTELDGAQIAAVMGDQGRDDEVVAINIMAINDAPSISDVEPAALAYRENDSATSVSQTLTLADIDDAHLSGATVAITAGHVGTQDRLNFVDQNGISGSFNHTTGVLTLTGTASVSDYQTALRSVGYQNLSDNPETVTRTVTFTIADPDAATDSQTRDIAIEALNDDPVNAGSLPAVVTVTEDVATNVDLSAINLNDPDHGGGQLQIRIQSQRGGLLFATDDLAVTASGSGTATLTLAGTRGDLNIYLNDATQISYHHGVANHHGVDADTLRVIANDGGNRGTGGGGDVIFGNVRVDITAVNDAPVADGSTRRINSNEDVVPVVVSVDDFTVGTLSDVDGDDVGVAITSATYGSTLLEYSTDGGASWIVMGSYTDSSALLLRGTDQLRSTQNGETGGLLSLWYRGWDQTTGTQGTTTDASTTGGSSAFSDNVNTFEVDYQDINDAPVVTAPGSVYEAIEQTDLDIHGTGLTVDDVDAAGGNLTATLQVGEGLLTIVAGNSGAVITSGNGTGSVVVAGTLAQIDDLLTGGGSGTIRYQNTLDDPSASTLLTVTVNDRGNRGTDPGTTGDAASEQGSASQTIHLTAVNDDPTDAGTLPGDVTVTEDVLSNVDLSSIQLSDPDARGGDMTVTLSTSSGGELTLAADAKLTFGGTADARSISGTLDDLNAYLNIASNIQYQHAVQNTQGDDADTITVVVNDGGNRGTGGGADQTLGVVNVDITAVNDAPVADAGGPYAVDEGASVQLDAGGSSDVEGIQSYEWDFDYDGTFNPEATGQAATFDASAIDGPATRTVAVRVTDTDGDTHIATSTVTIQNVAPSAADDALNVDEDAAGTTVDVRGNDTDPVDDLTIAAIDTTTTLGIVTDHADGTFTYDPAGRFEYLQESETVADTFAYTVADGDGGTSTATVTVTIAGVNDAPRLTVTEGLHLTPIQEDPIGNPGDRVVDILTSTGTVAIDDADHASVLGIAVTAVDDSFGIWQFDAGSGWRSFASAGVSVGPANDSAALLLAGTDRVRFVPAAEANGTAGLTFRGWDRTDGRGPGGIADVSGWGPGGSGQSGSVSAATATARILVQPVNDQPPEIVSGGGADRITVTVDENTTAVTTIVAADDELPEATLRFRLGGVDAGRFTIGELDGVLQLADPPDFETPADADGDNVFGLTVIVSDGENEDSQVIEVILVDTNEFDVSPLIDVDAARDAVQENAAAGTAVGIEVFGVDLDGSDNEVDYALVDDAGGRFVIDPLGGQIVTARRLDHESEGQLHTVTVLAQSVDGSVATASWTISLDDVNERPRAAGESFTTLVSHPLVLSPAELLANDSDVDGDPLTVLIVGPPGHGSITIDSSGNVVYTPAPGTFGTDTFTYVASDGVLASEATTVTVRVETQSATTAPPAPNNPTIDQNASTDSGDDGDGKDASERSEPSVDGASRPVGPIQTPPPQRETQMSRPSTTGGGDGQPSATPLGSPEPPPTVAAASVDPTRSGGQSSGIGVAKLRLLDGLAGEELDSRRSAVQLADRSSSIWVTPDSAEQQSYAGDTVSVGAYSTSIGLASIGYVLWALRGGMFAATFYAGIPQWRALDPETLLGNYQNALAKNDKIEQMLR